MALTSARRPRAHAQRRCGPIGPLSDVAAGGRSSVRRLVTARAIFAAWPAAWDGARAVAHRLRTPSYGIFARSASAEPTMRGVLGSGAGSHWGGISAGVPWRLESKTTLRRSVPETPSTMEWCTLLTTAQRPSPRPSATHISHSGFERSSFCAITRPTRLRISWSPPGAGSAVRRTW
jgi:hypothetical protein